MQLNKVRRLAGRILKAGKQDIWFNPGESAKIAEAMTKDDVRGLIKSGLIKKKTARGHSSARAKALHYKKKAGLKRGEGKRKGKKRLMYKRNRTWIKNVRAQRKELRELKKNGGIGENYGKLYRMVKGAYFRGKRHIRSEVKEGKV